MGWFEHRVVADYVAENSIAARLPSDGWMTDLEFGVPAVQPGFDVEFGAAAVAVLDPVGRLLLVLVSAVVLVRVTRWVIGRVDESRTREQLLFFVPKVVGVLAILVGLMASGVDVSGMAAVLATVGFTGAVVFTPVGQNFVAGAMIAIDDLYRPGEVVTVGDLHGRVVFRSLLRTELELPDDTKAWVPNAKFQDGEVLNHSRMGGCRIEVVVPLDRAADRHLAVTTMERVLAGLVWSSRGKTPFVAFDNVGSEAMFYTAFAWIDDRTQEPFYRGLLLTALVDALEAVEVSVGQTTNLSISRTRREAATSA